MLINLAKLFNKP